MRSSHVRQAVVRVVCLGIATASALGLLAAPASAEGPEITRTTVYGDGYSTYDCGFEVAYSTDLRVTTMVWYDEDRDVVRQVLEVHNLRQTWTSPTTGATLDGLGGGYTLTWDGPDTYATLTGHLVSITVPGEGVVLQDAGRVQLIGVEPPYEFPFVAGRHDFWFGRDRLCAYLQ